MMTALTILFAVSGMFLIFTPYFLLGFLCIGISIPFWKRRTIDDEEQFIAFLAVSAFLGVLVVISQDIIARLQ
jgi:ABC-type cobalamin transport system permease subunit